MKQLTASLAALVLGVGIGFGIGFMVSKPKLNKSQAMVEELMTQMQASKAESEETIRKASAEIARSKNDLARSQSQVSQFNTELVRLRAELAQLKNQNIQPVVAAPPAETATKPVINPAAAVAPTTPSTEYIVKDGDNLWNIAEQQLGNGMRYKEILLLNPTISENKALVIGTKLKIPAQRN
jgi:nucleoid-associated protein YgaU